MPRIQVQTQEMPRTPLPPLIRNAWGDEVANTFIEWVDVNLERHIVTQAEYREVLSRVGVLEKRMTVPERAVEQNRLEFHQRFDGIQERFDQRFDGMQARFDGLRSDLAQQINALRTEMQEQIQSLRTEVQEQNQSLRVEMQEQNQSLRVEVQEQIQSLRTEMQEQNQTLRTELKEELREHRRETRIALDGFRQEVNGLRQEVKGLGQEMQENFQTLHTQMLVQTRWMIGSLTVIGALVTLLLTIGTFFK